MEFKKSALIITGIVLAIITGAFALDYLGIEVGDTVYSGGLSGLSGMVVFPVECIPWYILLPVAVAVWFTGFVGYITVRFDAFITKVICQKSDT